MGVFDKAKDLIEEHEEQVEEGLEKVHDFVDDKTGGEHSEQIDDATEKAKNAVRNLKD